MSRYFIESVQAKMTEGGFACGPVPGDVSAQVKVRDESGKEFYIALIEVTGIPCFYKTDTDCLDALLHPEDNEDRIDELMSYEITGGDYEDILRDKTAEYYPIYRYLIYIVRADQETYDQYADLKVGKYIDEIQVPDSDVEPK